jgi:hypothetical protein
MISLRIRLWGESEFTTIRVDGDEEIAEHIAGSLKLRGYHVQRLGDEGWEDAE